MLRPVYEVRGELLDAAQRLIAVDNTKESKKPNNCGGNISAN